MAEPKRIDEEILTAELASYPLPAEHSEKSKLAKGPEPKPPESVAAASKPMPLFSESEMEDCRSQWNWVEAGFVNEPRRTVQEADKLVAALMQRLGESFANDRSGLEPQWDWCDNVSTAALRIALQRYLRSSTDC